MDDLRNQNFPSDYKMVPCHSQHVERFVALTSIAGANAIGNPFQIICSLFKIIWYILSFRSCPEAPLDSKQSAGSQKPSNWLHKGRCPCIYWVHWERQGSQEKTKVKIVQRVLTFFHYSFALWSNLLYFVASNKQPIAWTNTEILWYHPSLPYSSSIQILRASVYLLIPNLILCEFHLDFCYASGSSWVFILLAHC